MTIYELIETLENELIGSKNLLFSKRGAVDIEKCEQLVSDIKKELPNAIQEATYLLAQKDKIIYNAEESAKKIIKNAESNASLILNELEIQKYAEERANSLIEQAEKQCEIKQNIVKNNIDKLLKSIEDYLKENLHIVRNNREELAGTILLSKKDKDKTPK